MQLGPAKNDLIILSFGRPFEEIFEERENEMGHRTIHVTHPQNKNFLKVAEKARSKAIELGFYATPSTDEPSPLERAYLEDRPAWRPSCPYWSNSRVRHNNKDFVCVVPGSSGQTGPQVYEGDCLSTIADGTVVWAYTGGLKDLEPKPEPSYKITKNVFTIPETVTERVTILGPANSPWDATTEVVTTTYGGGRQSSDGKEIITGDTVEGDDAPQIPDDKKEENGWAALGKIMADEIYRSVGINPQMLASQRQADLDVRKDLKKFLAPYVERNDKARDQLEKLQKSCMLDTASRTGAYSLGALVAPKQPHRTGRVVRQGYEMGRFYEVIQMADGREFTAYKD